MDVKNKTDAEIIHLISMEFQSLNRIVARKAANWQIAYRESIRVQHDLLTEFFNRKNNSNNEVQTQNEEISR